jgi:hypothetical protein
MAPMVHKKTAQVSEENMRFLVSFPIRGAQKLCCREQLLQESSMFAFAFAALQQCYTTQRSVSIKKCHKGLD